MVDTSGSNLSLAFISASRTFKSLYEDRLSWGDAFDAAKTAARVHVDTDEKAIDVARAVTDTYRDWVL